ncbi:hypothetical protein C8J56DRAFT_718655, partial [Mycena floridula]
HICPQCSKGFKHPSDLRIHLMVHTDEKPFRCPYPRCGLGFNVKSNMARHAKAH